MAGDWLKVEQNTPDKPEVWAIAEMMGIDPDQAFGIIFRCWCWFDSHTESGSAKSVTKALLDRKLGATGFAEAMESVGWLVETDDGLTLPNFLRHNGSTAKKRAENARRAAKSRFDKNSRSADVTESCDERSAKSVTKSAAREEKRREEYTYSLSQESDLEFGTLISVDGFEQAWSDWVDSWNERTGKGFSAPAAQEQLLELDRSERASPGKSVRDLRFSLRKQAKDVCDSDSDYSAKRNSRDGPPAKKRMTAAELMAQSKEVK